MVAVHDYEQLLFRSVWESYHHAGSGEKGYYNIDLECRVIAQNTKIMHVKHCCPCYKVMNAAKITAFF